MNAYKNITKVETTKVELTYKPTIKAVAKNNKYEEWDSKESQDSVRKTNKN